VADLLHVDLFSGAGGFACGLRAAGWTTAVAVEKVGTCVRTYRHNFPGVQVIPRDIRVVTGGEVVEYLPLVGGRRRGADLVTAGFPCETNSTAGTKSRHTYDHRLWLYRDAIRIARAVHARVILFENVVPIRTKQIRRGSGEYLLDHVRRDLDAAGYTNRREFTRLASELGVPQTRRRWFLVATRENLDIVPPEPVRVTTSVREALGDLPRDPPGGYLPVSSLYSRLMRDGAFWRLEPSPPVPTQHEALRHRPGTVVRNAMIRPGGWLYDQYTSLDAEVLARLQAYKVVPPVAFKQRGHRLDHDRPAATLTSHCEGELVHPARPRALTVREAARLQSFPDMFEFRGPPTTAHENEVQDRYEQVGDAVAPLVAWSLGMAVRRMLTGRREDPHPLCHGGESSDGHRSRAVTRRSR
jgi:DNA (cytosine-5)-methyltransferase 1